MKGKGKGDRGGDVKGKNSFTDFAHLDISKKCPIFSSGRLNSYYLLSRNDAIIYKCMKLLFKCGVKDR